MSDTDQSKNEADLDGLAFRKSLLLQIELQEVLSALGDVSDLKCLEIGSSNAMYSYQLRRAGGLWRSLAADAQAAARIREGVENDVDVLPAGDDMPFEKHTFDVVVVLGVLETIESDAAFVKSCHRILKPDGRLIICAARQKSYSLINPVVRHIASGAGLIRAGYTESRLFAVLKSGFDVFSVHTYSRFFMTVVDAVVQSMVRRHVAERTLESRCRFYKTASLFYGCAYQFDALLFLTRGHRMIAVAKRRGWRSREAPILNDGRSISEAVLKPLI